MTRATNAVASRKRKKRLFKQTKGFWGDRKNHLRQSSSALLKALAYNYVHRKKKKGDFRRLWIMRIGVAAKMRGLSYSKLIHGMKLASCEIDRKVLSELAIHDTAAFDAIANSAKEALAANK